MATIDNKLIIENIMKANGYYEGDPRIYMIVEYVNAYGKVTWGVTWINENHSARTRYLEETQYVRTPRVIWHCENQI